MLNQISNADTRLNNPTTEDLETVKDGLQKFVDDGANGNEEVAKALEKFMKEFDEGDLNTLERLIAKKDPAEVEKYLEGRTVKEINNLQTFTDNLQSAEAVESPSPDGHKDSVYKPE